MRLPLILLLGMVSLPALAASPISPNFPAVIHFSGQTASTPLEKLIERRTGLLRQKYNTLNGLTADEERLLVRLNAEIKALGGPNPPPAPPLGSTLHDALAKEPAVTVKMKQEALQSKQLRSFQVGQQRIMMRQKSFFAASTGMSPQDRSEWNQLQAKIDQLHAQGVK